MQQKKTPPGFALSASGLSVISKAAICRARPAPLKRLMDKRLANISGWHSTRLDKEKESVWAASGTETARPGMYSAKTRYRQTDAPCTLIRTHENRFTLHFDQPQWAATPGQYAVLYHGERCIGGGVIT